MPKPYKPVSTRKLPTKAEIIEHDGKPHVRWKDRGRSVLYPLTKDGTKYLRPAKCWYFDLRDAQGTVRRVKGFTDLKATAALAAEMERKVAREKTGIIDPNEEHLKTPLADHLKDYGEYLTAKGNVPAHNELTLSRITALCCGCGFVRPLDADVGKASLWLNALRRDSVPIAIPDGDAFKPRDVAQLLGISLAGVRAFVKRLNLPATGNGKARRLPRSTVAALVRHQAKGCAPATANHYTIAVRGFFRWLVRTKRLGTNPLESLSLVNASTDVRHARRELTADELRRLFNAARSSARTFRGLTGADRYFLYLTAAGTGFRASALSNLTPTDFDLNAGTVTLAARFNKSRKTKVQPLPPDVADALRPYLNGKPHGAPVWGGTWARDRRGAVMLRADLIDAGIPYVVEGPDGPEHADFHALRHSYLTLGGRSGIDLRTLQELGGHSTPTLTARYSHRRLYDLQSAVDRLPHLVPTTTEDSAAIPLRSTGTDGQNGPKRVVPGVVTGGIGVQQSALKYTCTPVNVVQDELPQLLDSENDSTLPYQPASNGIGAVDETQTLAAQMITLATSCCNHQESQEVTSIGNDARSAGRSDATESTAGKRPNTQGKGGSTDHVAELASAVRALPVDERQRLLLLLLQGAGDGKDKGM